MALTTFTNGTVANADEVNANFTFVNSPKADGTITVNNAAYGNAYADISFAAAELGVNDTITVEIMPFSLNASTEHTFVKPIINDVTTPQDLGEMDITANDVEQVSAIQTISSEVGTTQAIFYKYKIFVAATETSLVGKTSNTGESNPLTTAFTLRIDTKKGSNDATIKYRVFINRGFS